VYRQGVRIYVHGKAQLVQTLAGQLQPFGFKDLARGRKQINARTVLRPTMALAMFVVMVMMVVLGAAHD
jgi:hypothetical protein